MLGIQIDGEFLELPRDSVMELEKQNPFLQFDNNLAGDYSLPASAKANNQNLKLLQYAALPHQKNTNAGVDGMLYDDSLQITAGKIKIEKSALNLNKISKGMIDFYFVGGAGGFWQDIKDKKLRDVDLGGDRSFAWAGLSTVTDGFWKHIHQVVNGAVGAYDYAFYPVKNMGWPFETVNPPIMNLVYYDAMEAFPVRFPNVYAGLDIRERNRIVPFPYLKYVLQKTFDYIGWTLTGELLDDADFEKITMINFRAIDWCFVKVASEVAVEVPRNPVVFNLQDHMPDITIANFLIALKNRFGFWFDFDNTAKKATIKMLKDLVTGTPKDMTEKSSPLMVKKVLSELPVYALRNNFATSLSEGAPDFSVIDYKGEVNKTTDLPAAAEAKYGHVYLVREENNYYICQQNPDDEVWQWYFYAYNIYDVEPSGWNQEITTDATVIGLERHDDYLDLIPRIDNQGEWMGRTDDPASWGIHLAFYFGLRDNKAGDPYPFASHHIYDSQGYTLAAWSLAFEGNKTDGTKVGLHDLNWKPFLAMLSNPEEFDHTLYLPLHEYLQLKFSDRIIVNGIMLFIKQIKFTIPYKGQVQCTSIRI